MQEIELLAPAGNLEALKAAVQNGANAIYLGGIDFSARAYASNFDRETLKEAVAYAHIRGVKIYVTVNTLMKDSEFEALLSYIAFLYEIDVDAVIVQDIGVLMVIKKLFPDLEVHASTQMTIHNLYGIEFLKGLNINRVVLARELSIEEVKEIHEKTGMELEVFVHGALCLCYSGQCLMSSFIGGRSGNRGRCAQPCRKKYDLLNIEKNKRLGEQKAFYLSMRDLNTIEKIGELIEAGVTSFKIEGRMKKPQYVASIVKAYRKAIDDYLAFGNVSVTSETCQEMEQMFNRRFTKGYLFHSPKNEVINIEKSNNRGVYLGKVEDYDRRTERMRINLSVDIRQGDGIEVWNLKTSDIGGIVRGIYKKNKSIVSAKKGELVEIHLKGNIKPGDLVYKTLDVELMDRLEKTYSNEKQQFKIPLQGMVKAHLGQPIEFYLWDEVGNHVEVKSDYIVERAEKVPLTKEKLEQQLKKLGNTPFVFDTIEIDFEEGGAVPLSIINGLRREGIENLMIKRANRNNRNPLDISILKNKMKEMIEKETTLDSRLQRRNIVVKVDTLKQLRFLLNYRIHRVYYGDLNTLEKAVALCREKRIQIYFRSPSILKNKEYEEVKSVLDKIRVDGLLVGDLGMLDLNKRRWKLPMIADQSLNVMNSYSASLLKESGVKGITLSPELDLKSIESLKLNNQLEKEVIIFGKLVVMTTEYCPLILLDKECDHQCHRCSYPKYRYSFGLKDEKNMTFLFAKDTMARNIILNSRSLYMIDKLKDFKFSFINSFRLEFTDEDESDIKAIMDNWFKNIDACSNEKQQAIGKSFSINLKEGYTRGHYYRGVE